MIDTKTFSRLERVGDHDFPLDAIDLDPVGEKPDRVSYGLLLVIGFLLGFLVCLAALT